MHVFINKSSETRWKYDDRFFYNVNKTQDKITLTNVLEITFKLIF